MANELFKLTADYGTSQSEMFSANEQALRMFGKANHGAATIKPDLTITNPDGATIATMDEWAVDWVEA